MSTKNNGYTKEHNKIFHILLTMPAEDSITATKEPPHPVRVSAQTGYGA
jgi:hypothetical protein